MNREGVGKMSAASPLKRILIVWFIANFALVGIGSWIAGGWYLSWEVPTGVGILVELGLIMLPNLILPILVMRYGWPEPVGSIREALGWVWNGQRSVVTGLLTFITFYLLVTAIVLFAGASIPYHMPGAAGEGIAVRGPGDLLLVLGTLLGLMVYVALTVAGEETMFRGWIQTQVGSRYGPWPGLLAGAALFGLRHLPADIFYARVWQATPQMWLSRELQLYLLAILLGLARHYGKSTYASAIMHGLVLLFALFGLG